MSLLIGTSQSILHLRGQLKRVAAFGLPALITGPTGCGKELAARELHRLSNRSSKPFVTVDCGTLPEHLVESELFGHREGSFTHATRDRPGLVQEAEDGCLFLDEVDSLTPAVQPKLLRFLDSREYRSVGANQTRRSGVWVIAATNADLGALVRKGTFRADLYYRMQVVEVRIPALKERAGDILLLAEFFLRKMGCNGLSFSRTAREALQRYDWPGNVRELKHRVEAAAIMAEDGRIGPALLGLDGQNLRGPYTEAQTDFLEDHLWSLVSVSGMTLLEATSFCEETLIRKALQEECENRTRAAQRLGIHVRTIFKKLAAAH